MKASIRHWLGGGLDFSAGGWREVLRSLFHGWDELGRESTIPPFAISAIEPRLLGSKNGCKNGCARACTWSRSRQSSSETGMSDGRGNKKVNSGFSSNVIL